MRLDRIPADVLYLIFTNLCYHCQKPGNFVNADEHDVVENKKALARLCRTNKAICTVAQPILYHYYATGNICKAGMPYRGHWNDVEAWDYDFFPQFLRTIIARPDLAGRVKSLQIILGREQFSKGTAEVTHPGYSDAMSLLLNTAKERHLLPWRLRKDSRERYSADTPFDLEELFLIGLQCMNKVHTLLIAWQYDFASKLKTSDGDTWPLPPLLIRASEDFNPSDRAIFFNAAPNLSTLYVSDSGGWSICDHYPDILNYAEPRRPSLHIDCESLGLFRLRKLSLNSLTPTAFSTLIFLLTDGIEEVEAEHNEKFPRIEDLEFYWSTWDTHTHSLDWALGLLSNTLKRLCLSYIQPSRFEDIDRDCKWDADDEYEYRVKEPKYDTISSLSMFPLLVDVTVDLRSIYRDSDPEVPDRFVSFLPSVVERFRITYAFRGITRELWRLGERAHGEFPRLKVVVVGVPYKNETMYHEGLKNMKASGVDDLFESQGVDFAWTVDFMGADLRTMVPGMSVGLPLVPLSGIEERN